MLRCKASGTVAARKELKAIAGQLPRPLEILISPTRSVAENLALDEELTRLAAVEHRSVLRLWWGDAPTVVMGRSEKPEQVVNLEACSRLGVPVLRRLTGGGTVLQTAGVLNYSLTGPAAGLPDVRAVFSLGARLLVGALARMGLQAEACGISDVAIGRRKISGNAMAKRWGGLLLHGTLLYDLELDLVEACLRHPPREPDYRGRRSHKEFMTTLVAQGVAATPRDVEDAMVASARELAAVGLLDLFPHPSLISAG